jgi:hypothetical protein
VAREGHRWIQNTGGPLDLSEGSCLGTSQEKVENLATGIARLRDSDIPTAGAVWAIAEREWNTGGTKDSRVAKCRGAETRVDAESRSAEEPRFCGRVAEYKVGPRISGTRGLGG